MDDWAALRLQIEWGADEALEMQPVDRLRLVAAMSLAVALQAPQAHVHEAHVHQAGVHQAGVHQAGVHQAGAPARATLTPVAPGLAAAMAAGAATIAELRAAVAAFNGCALRDTATSMVFAEGISTSGLMLIGDPPGADDDRAGRPFSGPAGAYLDRLLASIGLERSRTLLTPLIPWRPPGDRVASAAELAACLPFLWRLIVLASPRHVLLLGPLAARNLLPQNQRRRARGTWVNMAVPGLGEVPTLPGISLAALLRQPAQRREAWADLRKMRREIDKGITNA